MSSNQSDYDKVMEKGKHPLQDWTCKLGTIEASVGVKD
jgi:hypothetical protein